MRTFRIIMFAFTFLAVLGFLSSGCMCKAPAPKEAVTDSVAAFDGNAIVYSTQGEGSPAYVFIHGWCCDRSHMEAYLERYSEHHRVVTIDLPGHGQSGKKKRKWSTNSYGRDVRAVLHKLDLQEIILIGHSMGGPVSIETARMEPDRIIGIIGIDTFHDLSRKYTRSE
ncbi:alpha/beta hydrolase, partial [bacterium]|nr:alpha/beta hydrolase [bacterium]